MIGYVVWMDNLEELFRKRDVKYEELKQIDEEILISIRKQAFPDILREEQLDRLAKVMADRII